MAVPLPVAWAPIEAPPARPVSVLLHAWQAWRSGRYLSGIITGSMLKDVHQTYALSYPDAGSFAWYEIGPPNGLFMALLPPGVTAAPANILITVAAGGVAAGATAIPVMPLPAAVPRNTILIFSRAATSPDIVAVVVRATAPAGATSLPIEMLEGEEEAPLEHSLAAGDAAVWDQLLTVAGARKSTYRNAPRVAAVGDMPEIHGTSPKITYSGLFLADGQLARDLLERADTNREWWVRQTVPNRFGAAAATRWGRVRVTNLAHGKPAGALIKLSFTARFVEAPVTALVG